MAKLLFFIQVIVALVVLPFWPGLDTRYALLGVEFLVVVLTLPWLGVVAVHGVGAAAQAWTDAWSPGPLGPRSRQSAAAWSLAVGFFPLAGAGGGLLALIGALQNFDAERPWVWQALLVAFFCLVWGLLGLLVGRILNQVVTRLSLEALPPLLALTEPVIRRFGLTPREAEAAQAVLDGLTYQGAAEKLSISPATVKSHVLSVYQKTGVGNKIELLRLVEAENQRLHQSVDGSSASRGSGWKQEESL